MTEKKFLATITRTVDIEVVVWAESEQEARELIDRGEGDWEEIQQDDSVDTVQEYPA